MITSLLMLGLTLVATVTDIRSHKIYNWNTYTGLIAALAIASINSFTVGDERMRRLLGSIELSDSALGLFLCGGMLMICYLLFSIGGGDVKLLGMLGAFLGFERGIEVVLWTLVLGGAMALVMIVWKTGPATLFKRFVQTVKAFVRLRGFAHLRGDEPHSSSTLFLAPSALVALLFVHFGLLRGVGLY